MKPLRAELSARYGSARRAGWRKMRSGKGDRAQGWVGLTIESTLGRGVTLCARIPFILQESKL